MTSASLALILAQIADLMISTVGVSLGATELNPLGFCWSTIALKIAVTILVCWMLQHYRARLRWLVWIPAGLMAIVCAWNMVNIALMI